MSNWQANLLRFTLFPAPVEAQFDAQVWWDEIIGESPDKINLQPKLGKSILESEYELGKIVLQVQPDRIDWQYVALEIEIDNFSELPTLGEFSDSIDVLKSLVFRWLNLDSCPLAKRIAFGATLVHPTQTREEAYEYLDKLLHDVKIDAQNSQDFHYNINRPRNIQIDEMDILVNRLSKWRTITVVRENIPNAGETYAQLLGIASVAELDINTSPTFSGFSNHSSIVTGMEKLIELGVEIATEGDIP